MKPGFYNNAAAAEHYIGIRWPRAIWRAVLDRAIQDALGRLDVEDAPFADDITHAARHWIADTENEPRRFVWVCELLGLEPTAVRTAIERRYEK